MGGGNSKTKASEKVDKLETNIEIQNNERYESRQSILKTTEKEKSKQNGRSKSVNNWNTIQPEETDIKQLEKDYDTAINVSPDGRDRKNSTKLKEFDAKRQVMQRQIPDTNSNNYGTLDETTGSRRERVRQLQSESQSQQADIQNSGQQHGMMDDQEYENILNEAIIQSILEQDRANQQQMDEMDIINNSLPTGIGEVETEDDRQMKEIMKISSFEYQKQTGGIDLSHIKRKKKPETNINHDIENSLSDDQLARLAKMIAPSAPATLAPLKGKKSQGNLKHNNIDLEESQASMMQFSVAQTNDQTIMAYPSQSVLQNFQQLEEQSQNKQSPFKTHKFDDLTNSGENWDISIGKGKNTNKYIDQQLEKVVNQLQQKDQEDDWNDLANGYDQDPNNLRNSPRSPSINKTEVNDGTDTVNQSFMMQSKVDVGELHHKLKNSESFAIISQSDVQESQGNDEQITTTDKYIAAPKVNLTSRKDNKKQIETGEQSIKDNKSETQKSILDELDDLF